MKGVVLAGGTGSRLRPITYSMAKQLIPIANTPILFYGLRDLAAAGIRDTAIIISPETGAEIREAVGDGSDFGLKITYIVQDQPLGLAHALKMALPFIDDDDVLMYLGDNLVRGGITDVISDFEKHRPNSQILLQQVSNPSSFGVAELDDEGHVVRLVEKPRHAPSDLALVGVYLFDDSIGEAIDAISPSPRGEYEITDAIQQLIDNGKTVRSSLVQRWWKDTGRKSDLLHANELILEDLVHQVDGELIDTAIQAPVVVGRGATITDCQITGPAVIGENVHLTGTVIGPNTAIGPGSRITNTTIEASIILEESTIDGWRIRNSLVGRRSHLDSEAPPGFAELAVGESTMISFQ